MHNQNPNKYTEFTSQLREAGISPLYMTAVVSMTILFLFYLYFTIPPAESPSSNVLAIGEFAKIKGEVNVPIFRPVALSNLSRAEILKHRSDIVELSANLLHKKYSPTGEVFAKMKSGLPWFSLHGFFYRGRGIRSLEGPSAESRHLSNPFLLISPEFWGLSRWVPGGIKWDETKLNQREFNKPDFPYYPIPNQMTWYPDKSSAQVTFLLSNFIDKLNLYAQEVLSKENISFGLTAYNARDFGFKYLAIDTKRSKNLKSADNAENPVEITDRITNLPRFCSYDSRCNHLDIPMLDADQIVIGPLPAHVYIKLWYNLPKDKDDPPNMYFMFNFK